jgi:hypothetical protein
VRALNFYSSNYHSQLICRRKNCTVRMGDKSQKYTEGDLIWITVGRRYHPRKKIYAAVIDKVVVKPLEMLSIEELQGENPELCNLEGMVLFLQSIYDRTIQGAELITVIYFSEILEE